MRFQASASALRALEATLIVFQDLGFVSRPLVDEEERANLFIDSRTWQKHLLAEGIRGEELKSASLELGKKLFPSIDFTGFKDADGILIAEYARRILRRKI